MTAGRTCIQIIASPSDVRPERLLARVAIREWNEVHSTERRTVLLPITWETHAAPAMGDRAQAIINRQIVRDSDLLVAIFWTRIGTPTGGAESGTIEEIEEHLNADKPVMLYFSVAPVRLDSVNEDQYRALRQFKASARQRGLNRGIRLAGAIQREVLAATRTIIRHFPPRATEGGGSAHVITGGEIGRPTLSFNDRDLLSHLSVEARELLREAVNDRSGTVLIVETLAGLSVETHEKNFADRGNPRSVARWRRAVNDLVQHGLLEQRDHEGQVFSITDEGYRVADLLSHPR